MIKFKLYLFFLIVFSSSSYLFSQKVEENEIINQFYFDAIVFKGDTTVSRVDLYTIVPYESLNFIASGKYFIANYEVYIVAMDSNGNKFQEIKYDRRIKDTSYFIAKGGNAAIDYSQKQFFLPEGKFKIRATLIDKSNNLSYERTRAVTVINFDNFNISLSALFLLSSIEEINGKYKITPHISDNIGNLKDGFFAFFESYQTKFIGDSVDYVWEISNAKNELIANGKRVRKQTGIGKNQIFLHIPKIPEFTTGSYTLRILALRTSDKPEYDESHYLAIAQRSLNYTQTVAGNVLADINIAIKQLRYIAYQSDLDLIENVTTESEKQNKFEQFWKKHDPTPGTERNEAFDEYYSRIAFSSKTFKSYLDGWLTDMGMVHVIFGPPANTEKYTNYGDGRIYEKWYYRSNREFIFVDNSGFGDFRLVRPMSVSEKYQFQP